MRYKSRRKRNEKRNVPQVRQELGRVDYGYNSERRVYLPTVYDEEKFSWWNFTMRFCDYLFTGVALFYLVFLALILIEYRF